MKIDTKSSIIYENILVNIDIEYILSGNDIKENIIVKSKSDNYSYVFILDIGGLTATLNERGEINLCDSESGDIVYVMPAPYMFDAKDELSYEVNYTLKELSKGKYELTVTADEKWINSTDRAFPVTIDPTIIKAGASLDLYITQNAPDSTAYATTDRVTVGSKPSSERRGYFKFVLPSVPRGGYISNATFNMQYFQYSRSSTSDSSAYLGVYRVTSNWDASLTWNKYAAGTAGAFDSKLIDYKKIIYPGTNGILSKDVNVEWDITEVYKGWQNGEYPNYGIMLMAVDGYKNSSYIYFRSTEADGNVAPYITVSYRDMKGVEPYFSTTSHSAGTAGNGYVNNATGKLTFVGPSLSSTDNVMPISIGQIYNSELANLYYNNANANTVFKIGNGNSNMFTAKGWKLNISETVITKQYDLYGDNKIVYFIYADSDGTEHYFLHKDAAGNTYYTMQDD